MFWKSFSGGALSQWRRAFRRHSCCVIFFFLQYKLKEYWLSFLRCLVYTVLVAAPLCVVVVLFMVLPLDACSIHGDWGHQTFGLVTAAAETRLGKGTNAKWHEPISLFSAEHGGLGPPPTRGKRPHAFEDRMQALSVIKGMESVISRWKLNCPF